MHRFDPEHDTELPVGDLPNFRITNKLHASDVDSSDYRLDDSEIVPEPVRQFVTYFRRYLKERKVHDIHYMYETSFNKITEKYFKQTPWPTADAVAPLVENDILVLLLYKELYFRHIYANFSPSLEQRIDSWKNYCQLFHFFLDSSADLAVDLPNQWIWDITDEFIYQFQSFCQYRAKLKTKSPEELSILNSNQQAWNTGSVINFLQSLVGKSEIIAFLTKGKASKESELAYANHALFRMLGYCSLVGLLRVHCLLGDYYLAAKSVEHVELYNNKGLFTQVAGCHIALYYYLGFVYLMTRRYIDAIKAFSSILLYIARTKQYHTRSYQYDQILKKSEQMYGLLAICLSLCPQKIDETLQNHVKEKYSDKMQKMQKGDETCFEELFSYACPKFVLPSSPNYALILEDPVKYPPTNLNQVALKQQTRLFLNEVRQQALLPTIKSFLKLYTTIPTKKVADFLEMDEKEFRTQLLCFKHKTRGLVWNGGSPLNGEWASFLDIEFYVDKDMIHINDTKSQRRYTETFLKHINKCEEIIADIEKTR